MNTNTNLLSPGTDKRKLSAKSASQGKNIVINPLHNRSLNDNRGDVQVRQGSKKHSECQNLAESNLLEEVAAKGIIQAPYLYRQADLMMADHNDKCEENEEQIIESMQKKKELLRIQRKQQQKQAKMQKLKDKMAVIDQRKKQKQIKLKMSMKNQTQKVRKTPLRTVKNSNLVVAKNQHRKQQKKLSKQNINTNQIAVKKQMSVINLKPKPLQFNVNILDRMNMHSKNCKQDAQIDVSLIQKMELYKPTFTLRNLAHEEFGSGQNLNCKKMPFRFQGIL